MGEAKQNNSRREAIKSAFRGTGLLGLGEPVWSSNACTLCMLYKDVCHEEQVLKLIVQKSGFVGGEWSNCERCIEICEDNELKYSINKLKIRRV